jgi:transposase
LLDESGFLLTPVVRRTYAPQGETPKQDSWARHDRISAVSAITVSPKQRRLGLYFMLLPDDANVRGEDSVRFLRLLKAHIGPKMTVVWDRSMTHDRSKAVRKFLEANPGVRTERFPGYAPELNPDEGVWDYAKYGRMANFAPRDAAHLRRRLRSELSRLKRRPDLLASFIRHSGLPVAV